MAQLKTSPGDSATSREITDYLAYLRQQLQYEIDMREKLAKDMNTSLAAIDAAIAEIMQIIEE